MMKNQDNNWVYAIMEKFRFSFRFNAKTPEAFGLTFQNGKYIRVTDNTEWKECDMFDWGWGREYGFYKVPLGSFDDLINIIKTSDDDEDRWGAACILDRVYPIQLKEYLLDETKKETDQKTKQRFTRVFSLNKIFSRTTTLSMSESEKEKEYQDWKKISLHFCDKCDDIEKIMRPYWEEWERYRLSNKNKKQS